MSFLIPCPSCGSRDVNEFAYGGEIAVRPKARTDQRELASYLYFRRNVAGVQREWWFHRFGCELWFEAERDTRTNEVLATELGGAAGGRPAPVEMAIPPEPAV